MATFKYNWAMAEMAKLYLRNSCAQAKRKARKATEAAPATPGASTNSGLTGFETNAGQNGSQGGSTELSSDSDSDSDED